MMGYCDDCRTLKDYEYEIDELKRTVRRLKDDIETLKKENRQLDTDLYSANLKIQQELEPRIKREKATYDNWVTNPERR